MIRLANQRDLSTIMKIIHEIQEDMKQENNPQWSEDYPNEQRFLKDMDDQSLYVLEEDNLLKGILCIQKDDQSYEELLPTSKKPSFILHRLAVNKACRNQNIATKLMKFAEDLAKENSIQILKADTEKNNPKMNQLFLKLGYQKAGEFEYPDYPGHYIYYEKEIEVKKDEV